MQQFRASQFVDSPIPVPDELADRIFNSEVHAGGLTIKASDDLPSHPVSVGANISLFVHFSDSEERLAAFNALADGGKVLFPIQGDFGMVMDKFDFRWMLVCESEKTR